MTINNATQAAGMATVVEDEATCCMCGKNFNPYTLGLLEGQCPHCCHVNEVWDDQSYAAFVAGEVQRMGRTE